MSAYPSWLPGVAFLYARYSFAYGARFTMGDTAETASLGGFLWPWEVASGINSSWSAPGREFAWHEYVDSAYRGLCRGAFLGDLAALKADDRLLHALGFDMVPGETVPQPSGYHLGVMPSPLAIPLQSCDAPEKVDREAERKFVLDTFQRGHGDVYGRADVWRFRNILLDRPALRALRVGYALAGRVMVSPFGLRDHTDADASPWEPGGSGYLEGQFLGLEAGGWDDPTTRLFWRCSLLIARKTYEE